MSVSRNIVYNIAINVLNVAIPIVTVPYTSRILGVENIGIVNFAGTYAAYFALFVALGIPTYGVREIGKLKNNPHERNMVVSELVRIMCLSTLIFGAAYLISIFTVPTLRSEWLFLLVSGVWIFFAPLNVDWYFVGRENLKLIAVRSILTKVLGLVALFVFVRQREDIINLLIINVFLGAGSQVWNFFYMLRSEVRLYWRGLNLRRHLKPVLILFLSSLAISIYTMLDTLMLGFLSDYTQVGFYSSAIKISKLVIPFVTAAAAATIPRIAQLYHEKNSVELDRITNYSFGFMSLLAPPITIGLMAITPSFVPVFFGHEFMGVIGPMMTVSSVVLIIGISNFYGFQSLVATGKDKQFTYAVLVGMAVNFTLNLIVIPRYGAMGASAATVVAELSVTAATIVFATKYVSSIRPKYTTMLHSVCASLPMILFALLANRFIESDLWATVSIIASSVAAFVALELWVFRDAIFMDMAQRVLSAVKIKTSKK